MTHRGPACHPRLCRPAKAARAVAHWKRKAAIPNGLVVEWIPWSLGLFTDPPRLTQGVCHLSDRAGFGLTLSPALDRWEDA